MGSVKKSLRKMHIWLASEVPDKVHWGSEFADRKILKFVKSFSSEIFQKGGTIVHLYNPTLSPVLIEQSNKYSENKRQLHLLKPQPQGLFTGEKMAGRYVFKPIKNTTSQSCQDKSKLCERSSRYLRKFMEKRSHCIVSVGGMIRRGKGFSPGVMEEVEIALKKGKPWFNVGCFGDCPSILPSYFNIIDNNPYIDDDEKVTIGCTSEIDNLSPKIIGLLEKNSNDILDRSRRKTVFSKLKYIFK